MDLKNLLLCEKLCWHYFLSRSYGIKLNAGGKIWGFHSSVGYANKIQFYVNILILCALYRVIQEGDSKKHYPVIVLIF